MNASRIAALSLLTAGLAAQTQFREDPGSGVSTATRAVFVDIDGDGDQDLLQSSTNALVLQLNNGSGAFSPVSLLPSPGSLDLAKGDFDNDGDEDAILIGVNPVDFRLIRNDGVGATTVVALTGNTTTSGGGGIRVTVADLDGDNDLDFISSPTIGNLAVYLNDGTGFFSVAPNAFPTTIILGGLAASGDFDSDGDVDHLVSSQGATLYLNDGSASFSPAPSIPASLGSNSLTAVGDFTGDGIDDILGVSGGSGSLYAGDPTNILVEVSTGIPINLGLPFQLIATDIDDDGDLDAIGAGFGTFTVLVNDGAGSFTNESSLRFPASVIATTLIAGDIDGDQDPDLYATGPTSTSIYRNHHREVTVPNQPTIGGTLTLEVSYAPGYGTGLGLALPFVGPEAPARAPSPFGTVWIDTSLASALPFVGIVGINGDATLSVPVPNEPGLVGLAFLTQTLIFEPFDPSVNERLTGFDRAIIR